MDLNQFLRELKKYESINGNDTNLNAVIIKVMQEIQEIRADHNQGDADDADKIDENE